MDTLSYKTLSANKETANKEWFVVDAEGQTLGRMASKVAKVLRGKYKTNFDIGVPSKLFFDDEVKKYSYMRREGGQFSTEKYDLGKNLKN